MTNYAGDADVDTTWNVLSETKGAVLLDVRTQAEWSYVGLPQLAPLNKNVALAEWQSFPSMSVDPGFVDKARAAIAAAGGNEDTPVFCLCRSGARSIAAAEALTKAGFSQCFNVLDGFEGPPDPEGHRGRVAGWKARGLPWTQR